MDIQRRKILNAMITCASYDAILAEIKRMVTTGLSGYICLANVHMVVEGILNPSFNTIINSAVMTLPDGKPLSILMNLLYASKQKRIAGPDLMLDVLAMAEAEALPVYFYGSTPEIQEKMRQKLAIDFPTLKIAGMFSPPFRPLSDEEDDEMTRQIVSTNPAIILISLGCPKQERWMAAHASKIPGIMIGVGAGFPFYTGHVSRAPHWMQQYCLEWLFRIYAEPRRLLMRYVVTNSLFLILGTCQLLLHKLFGRHFNGGDVV